MNYILILIDYSPDYIRYTINTILSVDKDAQIYILSNKKLDYKNTTFVNLKDIKSDKISEFLSLNIYENSIFQDNPLWKTSALRVLYLSEINKLLNINSYVHFDNDVLIYKPYNEIKDFFQKEKLNITRASIKNIIFGYSFIGQGEYLSKLSDLFLDEIKYGIKHNWAFNNGKPSNEMQMLGSINKKNNKIFNLLPILPYQGKIIFDPSSYGQYIDGTHAKPKSLFQKGYVSLDTFIGVEIVSKRIKVKFKKGLPKVLWGRNEFDIANLHVHSKRLDKFIPSNYKNYI
tara:strand:- start:148 stop:1011 length:864 start_codon:yes stop_codon:yes gene_type:complete